MHGLPFHRGKQSVVKQKRKKKHKTVASASLSSVSVRVGAQRGCRLFQLMSQLAADREREKEKRKKTNLREPSGDPGLSACGSVCLHAKCAVTEGEQESNNPSAFHQAAPSLRQKPFWNISEKNKQTTNFPDHQLFSKQLTKLDQRQYSIFLANHVSASGNMSENGLGRGCEMRAPV